MGYQVENGVWSRVFAVPTDVVDRHIRLCGPLSLKVLLVLLRHGGAMEIEELSQLLGQSKADVQDALHYWTSSGVVHPEGGSSEAAPQGVGLVGGQVPAALPRLEYRKVEEPAGEAGQQKVVKLTNSRPRLTNGEIGEMAEKDEAIGYLLQEAQQVLGKPLNPVATDTVVSLYSYYGMEPDLILMLIQYCVSKGKSSMRYVEKVASTWLEKGIDTHERAEKEILRVSQQDRAESEIRRTFGIYDRSLVPSEKKYIDTWFNEYHMEIPLIQLAYERTVEVKGKLSFAYINGILANWRQKNIKTPAQAMQEMKRTREGPNRGKPTEASYDMAELEKMIAQGDWLK